MKKSKISATNPKPTTKNQKRSRKNNNPKKTSRRKNPRTKKSGKKY